jgi:hypothetical protein
MKNIQPTARRLKELQRGLARLGPVMRGSVVRLGPYKNIFFSLHKDGKTRLIYLGTERAQAAKACSDNYWKLLDIIEEMTILNMALLRQHYDPIKLVSTKTGRLKNPEKSSAG